MAKIRIFEFKDSEGKVSYSLKGGWSFFRERESPEILYFGWTGKIFDHEEDYQGKDLTVKFEILRHLVPKHYPLLNFFDRLDIGSFSKNIEKATLNERFFKVGSVFNDRDLLPEEFNDMVFRHYQKWN